MSGSDHDLSPAERVPTELWWIILPKLHIAELLAMSLVNCKLRVLSVPCIRRFACKSSVLSTDSARWKELSNLPPEELSVIEELYLASASSDGGYHRLREESSHVGSMLGFLLESPEAARYVETLNVFSEPEGDFNDVEKLQAMTLALKSCDDVTKQKVLKAHATHFAEVISLTDVKTRVRRALEASNLINDDLLRHHEREAVAAAECHDDGSVIDETDPVFAGLDKMKHVFLRDILRGQNDAILAFLLTLLPHVTTFRWTEGHKISWPKVELVITAIAKQSEDPSTLHGPPPETGQQWTDPLSKLTKIERARTSDDFDENTYAPHFRQIVPFLGLRSLQHVECSCAGTGEKFGDPNSPEWHKTYYLSDYDHPSAACEWVDHCEPQISCLPGRSRVREICIGNAVWSLEATRNFAVRVLEGPCTIRQGWKSTTRRPRLRMGWNVLHVPPRAQYQSSECNAGHDTPRPETEQQRQREEHETMLWANDFRFRLFRVRQGRKRAELEESWSDETDLEELPSEAELEEAQDEAQRQQWAGEVVSPQRIPFLDDLRDIRPGQSGLATNAQAE
ncbi:MAG: hypothetical protein M1831_000492 [Alyxoria varia]|nr:MAG: hypothetical protein M1831_000492 [Alyxoria varia]